MPRFPTDASKNRVIQTFERLGFRILREGNHIVMIRENEDRSRNILVLPNHRRIKDQLYVEYVLNLVYQEIHFWKHIEIYNCKN